MRNIVVACALGLFFGFALSRIGFSSWDEVHRMFTFADLRLLLTFGGAVLLLAAAWRLVAKVDRGFEPRPQTRHRGSIVGGLLFGAGWALCGACPSIVMVQLGEGQAAALFTLGGVLLGNSLYGLVNERLMRWPQTSCAEESS